MNKRTYRMADRSKWPTYFNLILWISLALIPVGSIQAQEPNKEKDVDYTFLRAAMLEYSGISEIHVKSRRTQKFNAKLFNKPSRDIVLRSTFEYWKSGDRYRIESLFDEAEAPGMNTLVAFDGEQYYWLTLSNKMLTIWRKRESGLSLLPSNPFFLPVAFVWKENLVEPPIAEWKDINITNEALISKLKSAKVIKESSDEVVYLCTGGIIEGIPFMFELTADKKTSLVKEVNRVDSKNNAVLTKSSIRYQTVKVGDNSKSLPQEIKTVMVENGKTTMEEDCVIEIVSIGKSIEEDRFTIDPRLSTSIFDIEKKKLIQREGGPKKN